MTSPVWFITGCSTGFGHELAKLVLACGWRTARGGRWEATQVGAVLARTGEASRQ